MAGHRIDPAGLSGEDLRRWYERSSSEIEDEARRSEVQKYADYAEQTRQNPQAPSDIRSTGLTPLGANSSEALWIADGRGNWRPAARALSDFQSTLEPDRDLMRPGDLPAYSGSQEEGHIIEIGSRSRQHRRGWELREGRPWPTVPETGENYHVSHIIPKGDGGPDTLDNIEPEHPETHIERHRANGDFSRFGKRSGRPKGGSTVRGLGLLGIVPSITGVLSGSIRMDTFDNFWSDMLGLPSEEDQRKAFEDRQRVINPKWKPGDPFVV